MSGFKAITVNTSPEVEPHIYAEDDAAIFQTIFGKDGVSTIGQQCEATVISNNKVRVADGVICVGGHFGRIPYGEYVDCEIQNGKTGVNRNDIIVAKFETTGTGGIDTFTCEVIQGTAGSTAADPEITENDLYSGGTVREFPLYRVKLEGLSIVSVDKLFNIIPTNAELLEKVNQLNSDFRLYITNHRTLGFTLSNVAPDTQSSGTVSWTLSDHEKDAISKNYVPIAIPLTCNYGYVSNLSVATTSTTGTISYSVLNHSSGSHTMAGSFLILLLFNN